MWQPQNVADRMLTHKSKLAWYGGAYYLLQWCGENCNHSCHEALEVDVYIRHCAHSHTHHCDKNSELHLFCVGLAMKHPLQHTDHRYHTQFWYLHHHMQQNKGYVIDNHSCMQLLTFHLEQKIRILPYCYHTPFRLNKREFGSNRTSIKGGKNKNQLNNVLTDLVETNRVEHEAEVHAYNWCIGDKGEEKQVPNRNRLLGHIAQCSS